MLPISPEHPEFVTLTWPQAVSLNAICLLWTGFAEVDVEAFIGKDDENVREAANSNWQRVARRSDMDSLYPLALGPQWISFDRATKTRALRLRITKGTKSGHLHLADKVKQGKRIWLGEVMALSALPKDSGLASLVLPKVSEEPPPIPVRFHLPEAGVVTLVIEDQQNHRVRNLVSETPFPAGDNIAWWDGSDDLLRDPDNHWFDCLVGNAVGASMLGSELATATKFARPRMTFEQMMERPSARDLADLGRKQVTIPEHMKRR